LRKLYLDLDGVLLRRRPGEARASDAFEVAPGVLEFLEWASQRFQCYWLSSRCRGSDPAEVRRAFRLAGALLGSDRRWAVIERIVPLCWSTSKAVAIDLLADFYWLDDDETERAALAGHGRGDRLIHVDANEETNALKEARAILSTLCGFTS
jgi:hypothetical protein